VWQRLRGVRVPFAADRRHNEAQWKNSPAEEDAADSAGENDAVARYLTFIKVILSLQTQYLRTDGHKMLPQSL
jgi:hypothetical protein